MASNPELKETRLIVRAFQLGMSVEAIARLCGVSCYTVNAWRRGDRPMKALYQITLQAYLVSLKGGIPESTE